MCIDIVSYLLGKKSGGGGSVTLDGTMSFSRSTFTELPEWLINAKGWENYTNMYYKFNSCSRLVSFPMIDTSNVTTMERMFGECTELVNFPVLNAKSVTNMSLMFRTVAKLSDESLDNILQMCITATNVSVKSLAYIGLTNYSASKIQTLPHYQDFIDAGWIIGY